MRPAARSKGRSTQVVLRISQPLMPAASAPTKTIGALSRDLGLTESAVRNWVAQAEIDAGKGPPGALTTAERQELAQLRRDNRRLRMERDILKKATAFFAKESR